MLKLSQELLKKKNGNYLRKWICKLVWFTFPTICVRYNTTVCPFTIWLSPTKTKRQIKLCKGKASSYDWICILTNDIENELHYCMYMGCSYRVQILFLHSLGPRTTHKNLKGFLFHRPSTLDNRQMEWQMLKARHKICPRDDGRVVQKPAKSAFVHPTSQCRLVWNWK